MATSFYFKLAFSFARLFSFLPEIHKCSLKTDKHLGSNLKKSFCR